MFRGRAIARGKDSYSFTLVRLQKMGNSLLGRPEARVNYLDHRVVWLVSLRQQTTDPLQGSRPGAGQHLETTRRLGQSENLCQGR